MPSIEIVCIGQTKPVDCSSYPFAVQASSELVSHRSPAPRFQSDFDGLSGVIYHLGNPDLKVRNQGAYFAYELLSESSRHAEPPSALEFAPAYASAVFDLLAVLINESKTGLFTVDERMAMLRETTAAYGNVRIESFRGLLVDFCRAQHAQAAAHRDWTPDEVVADYEAISAAALDLLEQWQGPPPVTVLIPIEDAGRHPLHLVANALAFGSIAAGYPFYQYFAGHAVGEFFRESVRMAPHILDDMLHVSPFIQQLPTVMMLIGFAVAYQFYIRRPDMPVALARKD